MMHVQVATHMKLVVIYNNKVFILKLIGNEYLVKGKLILFPVFESFARHLSFAFNVVGAYDAQRR